MRGTRALLGAFVVVVNALTLDISTTGGNSSGLFPIGLMFEDVTNGGDGGIHAQLLRNNAFQGDNPSLENYKPINGVELAIDTSNPLTPAITRALKVSVPKDATGDVGFSNDGYWGIPVNGKTHTTSFWALQFPDGDFNIKLVSADGKKTWGHTTLSASLRSKTTAKVNPGWKYFEAEMATKKAPNGDNLWTLTWDGAKTAGKDVYFDMVSLYPPTWKNIENGLKPQLAKPLAEMKPKFLRLAGGNNLEGFTIPQRWKWNETIGPLEERPGRQSVNGYGNTDAQGLLEYMIWAEAMEMEPLMDVFDGLALRDESNIAVGPALDPYIEDALNQIEYVAGDAATTEWGAVRAKHGREQPFKLRYVEIGNEDNLSGGCPSYVERFQRFYDAIHKAYPKLTIVASTADPNCLPKPIPEGVWLDFHRYDRPDNFVKLFNEFDNIPRTNKYLVNEFAVIDRNDGQNKPVFPFMQGSVAEAVYMIGMQRNGDLVQGAAYAPLIAHQNAYEKWKIWSPSLIHFRNQPPSFVLTTSYFVQQIFSAASSGNDTYLDVKADGDFGPVYWVASKDVDSTYYVKLANYGDKEKTVAINIGAKTLNGHLTTLSGPPEEQNDETHPKRIVPKYSEPSGKDGKFELTLPAWSVAVLRANEKLTWMVPSKNGQQKVMEEKDD